MTTPFLAQIQGFAFTYAPVWWGDCNGGMLQVSQFPALFSIIGNIYGGDGQSTMAIPNLQGRAPLHVGGTYQAGPGLTPYAIGDLEGFPTISLKAQEMPVHEHNPLTAIINTDTGTPSTTSFPGRMAANETAGTASPFDGYTDATPGSSENMSSAAVSVAGAGEPHENRQPFLTIRFCMALDGVYPNRN